MWIVNLYSRVPQESGGPGMRWAAAPEEDEDKEDKQE